MHGGGGHAVQAGNAVFPVEVVAAVGDDAADVALIWRIAELVIGANPPLRAGAPVFVVSGDHIFVTAAAVLGEPLPGGGFRGRGHAIEVHTWATFQEVNNA